MPLENLSIQNPKSGNVPALEDDEAILWATGRPNKVGDFRYSWSYMHSESDIPLIHPSGITLVLLPDLNWGINRTRSDHERSGVNRILVFPWRGAAKIGHHNKIGKFTELIPEQYFLE